MNIIPYARHWIDEDDIAEVVKVLKSDYLTQGPKLGEFEKGLCKYTGAANAVAVNSGTSALDIAVKATGVIRGEVITTPFTFVADTNAIRYNGLSPVYADINKETRNISPESVRKQITERTKGIICVDYAGHPCEMAELREIADEHGLFLIEDACHSLGGMYRGVKVGKLADMTIFSFHAAKIITTGEGGAVVTDNDKFRERLETLRTHGIHRFKTPPWAYDMVSLGRNYRMPDINAALGVSQLKKLDNFVVKRNAIARMYDDLLHDLPAELPVKRAYVRHAWHLYTILLRDRKQRDDFVASMNDMGIKANVHYIPSYKFTYYRSRFIGTDCPATEEVYDRIATLPLYPAMTTEQVHEVADTAKKVLGRTR